MAATAKTQSNDSQLLDQSYDGKHSYKLKDTSTLDGTDKTMWLSVSSPTPFTGDVDISITLDGRSFMAWTLEVNGLLSWSAPMQFDQIGTYTVTYSIAGATIATSTFTVAAKK